LKTEVTADPKLVEAFTLMWGAYPEPASLVHKSKTIIAVNGACREGGRKPGMNCAAWGSPDNHRGCRANHALKEQQPQSKLVTRPDRAFRVYWLPVPGYPDFYVHFTAEAISPESKTA
jgi:hypothetical protein